MQQPDADNHDRSVTTWTEHRDKLRAKCTLTKERQQMDPGNDERYEAAVDRFEAAIKPLEAKLAQSVYFGRVFASSGYRVSDPPLQSDLPGCTLDWALIEVDSSKVGVNQVSDSRPRHHTISRRQLTMT
jgi:hypothetical protein